MILDYKTEVVLSEHRAWLSLGESGERVGSEWGESGERVGREWGVSGENRWLSVALGVGTMRYRLFGRKEGLAHCSISKKLHKVLKSTIGMKSLRNQEV